ncbi:MAG: hypothetical protein AAF471_00550 [Myxococcota bacterium]
MNFAKGAEKANPVRITAVAVALVCFAGCSQWVHVKAPPSAARVVLHDKSAPVTAGGSWVQVRHGLGPVSYRVVDAQGQLLKRGRLERTKLDPLVVGLSVAGAAVAVPLLAWAGVNVANPSWSGVFAAVAEKKRQSDIDIDAGPYLRQSLSPWTIPIATVFGAIGLLPLVGLSFAGKLPSEVILDAP